MATNVLKRILVSAPGHAESWHLLGLLRHSQGYSKYGALCIEVAVRQVPSALLYRGNAIEVSRAADYLQQAVSHADILLELHSEIVSKNEKPSDPIPLDTYRALFDHLNRKKQNEGCLQLYEKHADLLLSSVIESNAFIATRTQENSRTTAELLSSVSMCAYSLSISKQKSKQQAEQKNQNYFEKSLVLLKLAIQIDVHYAMGWMKLATLLDHNNQFDSSLQIYKKAFHYTWLNRYNSDLRLKLQVEQARETSRISGKRILVIYCDEYGQTWYVLINNFFQ